MRKLLFILALLCVPLARGQSSFQNPLQGPITSASAACAVAGDQSCVWQKLAANAAVATVQVSGTFSATLTVEANNGGANFTTLGTITTASTTSYVVSAFMDFRVRASAYTSGTAVVTINSSSAPSGGVTSGTADPTGNACAPNSVYVQTTTGNFYTCKAGVFAIVGGSSSVSITGTAPIVVTPSPTTGTGVISAPTVVTSAAAITNNVIPKGSGGAQGLANSSITDNGTTVVTTEPLSTSANGALSQAALGATGTILTTGGSGTTTFPFFFLSASGATAATTWNTAGTAFGINTPSGFTGNSVDIKINGGATSAFTINAGGSVTANSSLNAGAGSIFGFSSRSNMKSPADGIIQLSNNAVTSFTRLDFGGITSSFPAIQVNGTSLQAELADGSGQTGWSAKNYSTETNCSSSGGTCVSASAGSVSIAAAATTVTVATTAVTAASQILIQEDSSLGTKLGVTCNTTIARTYAVTARTAATSFVITASAAPSANPACLSYWVIN